MSLYQHLIEQAQTTTFFTQDMIKRFEPLEIRVTIQALLASPEHHELAHALGDAGIALYPEDEDMLTVNGFLAVLRQDWAQVIEHLQPLLKVRAGRTDAATFHALCIALQKRMDFEAALNIASEGLIHHPEDKGLAQFQAVLQHHVNSLEQQRHAQ
jgi:phage pi2 protein 07